LSQTQKHESQLSRIGKEIASREAAFAALGVSMKQYQIAAVNIARKSPAIYRCRPDTIMMAVFEAAALGVSLDPGLKEAHLIAYKDECQLQIGYPGLLRLAHGDGAVSHVDAVVVYDGDIISISRGSAPTIEHEISLDPGKDVVGVYAVAHLAGGAKKIEYMSKRQIDDHRTQYSKARGSGPWATAWEEMAKKTVLIRLLKYIPMSSKAGAAIKGTEYRDAGQESPVLEAEVECMVAEGETQ
jgi:recombination protein RecT